MLSNAGRVKFDIGRALCALRACDAARRLEAALKGALPQACALCGAPCGNAMLCDGCTAQMPWLGSSCVRCALPLPGGDGVCGTCLAAPPRYTATIAAWRYAFPADRLLKAFKCEGRLALAEPLAAALTAAVAATDAQLPLRLAAVPLSAARQRERGFNHAHEIARRVSRDVGIVLVRRFVRTRDGPRQAGLTLRERARNVRGAFEMREPLDGLHVAIIDDVMTTGATLSAAASAALVAGAKRVDAWVVARTPPSDSGGAR